MATVVGFEMSVSGRDDGTVEAIYFSLRPCERVAVTKEIRPDVLIADYNSKGQLVGIEVLAPVRIADLQKLVERPQRTSFKKFVKNSAPRALILA